MADQDKSVSLLKEGKTILIPDMDHSASLIMAAVFKGVLGVPAMVLPTGNNSRLDMGKRYASGKECFPYIQTLADILTFLENAKKEGNDISQYLYFMPQAHGPCRFGQYHKAQDLILEDLGYGDLTIVSPTTKDSYTLGGKISKKEARFLRIVTWNAACFSDILNRIYWRSRPYEKEKGSADEAYEKSIDQLCSSIIKHAKDKSSIFASYKDDLFQVLREIGHRFKELIDTDIPRKPKVMIIGEIYMRAHEPGNQNLVRTLEEFGCETVTSSMAEWINYTTHMKVILGIEKMKQNLKINSGLNKFDISNLKDVAKYFLTRKYQHVRLAKAYDAIHDIIDIPHDHTTEQIFNNLNGLYHPVLYGEAVLSIASAITAYLEGYDGVVNCMPFGCMPSTNSDTVLKPIFRELRFPYKSVDYDDTYQPNREEGLAIMAHQAKKYRKHRLLYGINTVRELSKITRNH